MRITSSLYWWPWGLTLAESNLITIATTEHRSSPFQYYYYSYFKIFFWLELSLYMDDEEVNELYFNTWSERIKDSNWCHSFFWIQFSFSLSIFVCWFVFLFIACVNVMWWYLKWILRTPSYTVQFQSAQWMRKNISAPDANQFLV